MLYIYGFNIFWENQGTGHSKMFLEAFKNRLITEYKQERSDTMANSERYVQHVEIKFVYIAILG